MDLKLHAIQLTQKLEALNPEVPYCSKDTNTIIILCRNLLTKFHKIVVAKKFETIALEIEFFKEIKQVPLSNLIYYSEIRSLELHFPRANKKKQENYIRNRMDKINNFFIHNIDFTEYIDMEKTYLDEQYFTRKHLDEHMITHTKFYYLHPDFNTSHDLLLGKFIAYKRLVHYLYTKLNYLENPLETEYQDLSLKHNLQWTATKVALTELVYGLYHSGAINNGNVEIKEIAEAMSQIFHMDLGDYYRTYSEIRLRKKSRAKFIDKLSFSLSSKLESEDE